MLLIDSVDLNLVDLIDLDQTPPQGINDSANFRFLQRLSVIFGFRSDCPESLASCRDCCAW